MTAFSQEIPHTIRTAKEIAPLVGMDATQQRRMEQLLDAYPMAITPYYLSLIDWNDPDDPIRRMCVPSLDEYDPRGLFDTSGEADNTVETGLQHKYPRTALVLTTQRCAMYCRHCFRKRMVGQSDEEIASHLPAICRYIGEHPEIDNVLLSGGDALMLSNATLRSYLDALTRIKHLSFIRIGSRIPVVYPVRIAEDKELLSMLESYNRRKQLYIVTQFNHPNEVTPEAVTAIKKLHHRGIVIKNQTVLLGGVNDDPAVLSALLSRLTACGIVPYYVFQCRPVRGVVSRFQIPLARAYDVVAQAKASQSGQGKCFKFCMSHPQGKIEVIGKLDDGAMVFRYHQPKDQENVGKVFVRRLEPDAGWLPDIF